MWEKHMLYNMSWNEVHVYDFYWSSQVPSIDSNRVLNLDSCSFHGFSKSSLLFQKLRSCREKNMNTMLYGDDFFYIPISLSLLFLATPIKGNVRKTSISEKVEKTRLSQAYIETIKVTVVSLYFCSLCSSDHPLLVQW